jgi:hypothetical protein
MEEYKFPENNWYIEITDDNRKTVNDWKVKQEYNDDLFKDLEYTYVESHGGGNYDNKNLIKRGAIEITTEQFKQYVFKEPYKFKVGDKVRLLKSGKNWDPSMDFIVLKHPIVEITKINYDKLRNKLSIRFDGNSTWDWCFQHGHFELYSEYKKQVDYSYLEKILNKLGI